MSMIRVAIQGLKYRISVASPADRFTCSVEAFMVGNQVRLASDLIAIVHAEGGVRDKVLRLPSADGKAGIRMALPWNSKTAWQYPRLTSPHQRFPMAR